MGIPTAVPADWAWVIPLTQGYQAFVDEEDYAGLSVYRWKILKANGKTYAARSRKWPGGRYTTILMHRVITSAPRGLVVDHRNNIGLDNRRENLRVGTQRQNLANTSARGGTSRFKGVYWNKERSLWQASIGGLQVGGKQKVIYLGRFASEEEAALAYDRKAVELHGEFALLNLPGVTTGTLKVDVNGGTE